MEPKKADIKICDEFSNNLTKTITITGPVSLKQLLNECRANGIWIWHEMELDAGLSRKYGRKSLRKPHHGNWAGAMSKAGNKEGQKENVLE